MNSSSEDIGPNITNVNISIVTNPLEQELEQQGYIYTSISMLFLSLFLGYLIRSYQKTLTPLEKTTVVLLDIGITNYLQEIQISNC